MLSLSSENNDFCFNSFQKINFLEVFPSKCIGNKFDLEIK